METNNPQSDRRDGTTNGDILLDIAVTTTTAAIHNGGDSYDVSSASGFHNNGGIVSDDVDTRIVSSTTGSDENHPSLKLSDATTISVPDGGSTEHSESLHDGTSQDIMLGEENETNNDGRLNHRKAFLKALIVIIMAALTSVLIIALVPANGGTQPSRPSEGQDNNVLHATDSPTMTPPTPVSPTSTTGGGGGGFELPVVHPSDCIDPVLLGGENQRLYRGTQSTTMSGRTCQRWEEQDPRLAPHQHYHTPEAYPDEGLAGHNFCRNPDNSSSGVWCYTTDVTVRWEYCNLPTCATCGTASKLLADYRGTVNTTSTGKDCQAWSPLYDILKAEYPDAGLEENYCRNPTTGRNRTWCYVFGVAEECDVPACV